ncbi:MAG: hypothetical protein AAF438_07425 [Pseudomonadota bacterium]
MMPWSHISVGVAKLDVAIKMWVDEFGFEIIARHSGPDEGMAALWRIEPDDFVDQVLVCSPGLSSGMIHFVEFSDPGEPVRLGAQVFDRCPKNLDIHVDDLPEKFDYFKKKGWRFRSDSYGEVTTDTGLTFREIHIPAHDEINVVLLQVIGEVQPFNTRGFAGIGPAISVVPDAALESKFYQDILNLDLTYENYLSGPEIEKMVGLPPGAALNIMILGDKDNEFGRVELVAYDGVEGEDLYPKAMPKSLGFLNMVFRVSDLDSVAERLLDHGLLCKQHPAATRLFGDGGAVSFFAPSGFQLFVYQL